MSHDGLPARAADGARAARADRRASATSRLTLLRHALPAAAVTGALTIVFAACNSSGTAGSSAAAQSAGGLSSAAASTEASTEASASASTGASSGIVTVIFQPMNGSQVLGGAVLTDQPDGTTNVQIGIGSTGATDGMPAILQQGACSGGGASGSPEASGLPTTSGAPSESMGAEASAAASVAAASAPAASGGASGSGAPSGSAEAGSPAPSAVTGPPFQLTPLTGGASATTVATTTSALLAEPYSIVLNKSATDPSVVACADVTTNSVRVPSSALPSGLPSALPSLGTEPSPSSS